MNLETFFVKDGKTTILKTPAARLLYGWDLAAWLNEAGTSLQEVGGTGVGIQPDGDAFIQGTVVCVWITGLDESDGAANSYTFRFVCADGSVDYRTIHFIKRPA
ncbi:hypothetical protein ACFSQU_18100 [Massilia sp. GCM10020059]|uniref:Nuclear transport factor 2 family protein n=1 Tax=Massilia agrisoli TaxID=2892444 RepID=A0ABS8IW28_9BURK|nr:hypothetical protein [Massilia agrisoli]MCC6071455.1 hypothetical protein [Massilia agrisoli]